MAYCGTYKSNYFTVGNAKQKDIDVSGEEVVDENNGKFVLTKDVV